MSDTATIRVVETLEVTRCPTCGCAFAVPKTLMDERRHDGRHLYCPAGHPQGWYANSDTERLRAIQEQLQRERESRIAIRAEADQAWAAVSETKKELTSTRRSLGQVKRRAAAGVCPCCQRTVRQLADHIAEKHPGFAIEHLGKAPTKRTRVSG